MKFSITTLGCKVNTAESEILAGRLEAVGWTPADDGDGVDLCIVNTCTVTGKASMQCRQLIRQLHRRHPNARIVVTGCYAQTEPKAIAALDGVSAVLGTADKERLVDLVEALPGDSASTIRLQAGSGALAPTISQPTVLPFGTRTRPFLKVQDGCDQFCTYCIVPRARGRSRSMAPDAVVASLETLGRAGYREVVLTGIHLGAYGKDLSPVTELLDLMRRVEQVQEVARIRLSSIEPNELSDAMVRRVAESARFCRHFHLPLQSGDDTILRRMRRPYDRELYRDRVVTIREQMPDAAIGADVLVGFPGETDAAFANTLQLIESLPLTYLHVFPFSPRDGTPASRFSNPVPPTVVRKRAGIVRKLGVAKRRVFLENQVGRSLDVLIEQRRDRETGLLRGVSANYQTVLVDAGDDLKNRIIQVTGKKVMNYRTLAAS